MLANGNLLEKYCDYDGDNGGNSGNVGIWNDYNKGWNMIVS